VSGQPIRLDRWTVTSGSNAVSRAAVVLHAGAHDWKASADGTGAIDALFRAVDAALGTIVGIYAEQWDHTTFISNIVILPLAFVGGVFYSVDMLGSPWQELSHFNPLFYLIQAMRYGMLGHADVSVWLSLGVTAAVAIPAYLVSHYLFTTGRRLKA